MVRCCFCCYSIYLSLLFILNFISRAGRGRLPEGGGGEAVSVAYDGGDDVAGDCSWD